MTKTKIVATIGPACDSEEKIEAIVNAGVSVFRFNLKHTSLGWHRQGVERVKAVSAKRSTPIGILFDLQGPEIRTGDGHENGVRLSEGDEVYVSSKKLDGVDTIIIPHEGVVSALSEGNELYVDNDRIRLRVEEGFRQDRVRVKVVLGGNLGSCKSVVIPTLSHSLPTLTEKDKEYLSLAKEFDIDYIALSYVRSIHDIAALREEMKQKGLTCALIAKIETKEAVALFSEILEASDAIMVARGDLGVQLSVEEVPFYQKHIISKCLEAGKPVITATQMLETMIDHPFPTRAEVSDVANAIYDFSDAVMLSAETATGGFPLEAVGTMKKIAAFTESHLKPPSVIFSMNNPTDTIIHAASELAIKQSLLHTPVKAFVVLTESGYGARMLSRYRISLPIIALTQHAQVRDQLLLAWGVFPILFSPHKDHTGHVVEIDEMLHKAKETNLVHGGDLVVVIHGSDWGRPGVTNVVRLEQIP